MARSAITQYEDFSSLGNAYQAMVGLITPEGLQVSLEPRYRGAIYGRDSITAALDIIEWLPNVAEQVIISLARHQGGQYRDANEEEPGKIPHEYRSRWLGGAEVDPAARKALARLAAEWGGTPDRLVYYGSADVTPQYVRLVGRYSRLYGPALLKRRFRVADGTVRTVAEATLAAVQWIVDRTNESKLGLVEFQRHNPASHPYLTMRESPTGLLHEDGQPANTDAPIAALEIQAYSYDALVLAGELFPEHPQAELWLTLAESIRAAVFRYFWQPKRNYFGMALDRSPGGRIRLLTTPATPQAEILDTAIFDGLSPADAQVYLTGITNLLLGPEFLTSVGLRMRAWSLYHLLSYWDYSGSRTSWGVLTNLCARGLRRQGLDQLADRLEDRLLHAIDRSRAFLELWYLDESGQPGYDPFLPPRVQGITIAAPEIPKSAQLWTVSAVLRIRLRRQSHAGSPHPAAGSWQSALTAATINQLEAQGTVHIDVAAGRRLQTEFLYRHHH